MIKKIFFFLCFLVLIFGVVIFFRNAIVRIALNQVLTQAVGAETIIDKVNIGIFTPSADITGLKIYNPRGFINETFLEIPTISVKYDPKAILKKQLHIIEMKIALKELAVAISENGAINIDKLKVFHQAQSKPAPIVPFVVDKFTLSVGRVETKNYASKDNSSLASVDFKMKERIYKNISSFSQLAGFILIDTMKMAGVKGAQVYGEHILGDLGKKLFKTIK